MDFDNCAWGLLVGIDGLRGAWIDLGVTIIYNSVKGGGGIWVKSAVKRTFYYNIQYYGRHCIRDASAITSFWRIQGLSDCSSVAEGRKEGHTSPARLGACEHASGKSHNTRVHSQHAGIYRLAQSKIT